MCALEESAERAALMVIISFTLNIELSYVIDIRFSSLFFNTGGEEIWQSAVQ